MYSSDYLAMISSIMQVYPAGLMKRVKKGIMVIHSSFLL